MSSHRSKVHFSQYHSHMCVYVCMFVKVITEFIGMMTQPLFLNPITCRISLPLFDNGNGKTALSHIWHNISPISWVTQHHLQGFLVFHPSSFLPSFLLPSFLFSIFLFCFLKSWVIQSSPSIMIDWFQKPHKHPNLFIPKYSHKIVYTHGLYNSSIFFIYFVEYQNTTNSEIMAEVAMLYCLGSNDEKRLFVFSKKHNCFSKYF